MRKKILLVILIFCVFLNIFQKEVVFASNKYIVAGDENFPPYEYIDIDGEFKGFNVDFIKSLEIVTNLDFEFEPMPWNETFRSIDLGKARIIQGIKKSPKRNDSFLFSEPILTNSQSIFVNNKNFEVRSLNDLKGKKLALNVDDLKFKEFSKIEGIEIKEYKSFDKALLDLLSNKVDALIGNTLTINYFSNKMKINDKIKIVGNPINESEYCIAVSKNDTELLSEINAGINILKKNGMHNSIKHKWFGAPIKNVTRKNELIINILLGIFLILFILFLIGENKRQKLRKTVEKISEEQRIIALEMRRYDKMEFMDKIVSSIAHEIRNPLTSIKLYVNQLENKKENPEFLTAMSEDIPEEIDRIDGLISEFLEYSSPKKPHIENLNLKNEVNNTLSLVKVHLKSVELELKISDSINVTFDKSQLKQVILNIILNSLDAISKKENPKIKIKATESNDKISLYIIDNGIGIEESVLENIFEPFFTTKNIGNGLGLFVVKELLKENKGSIDIYSLGFETGTTIILKMKRGIEDNYEE